MQYKGQPIRDFITESLKRDWEPNIRGSFISFGAGIQSTAIAFLVLEEHPELERVCRGNYPQHFFFADTGDEPLSVYHHLKKNEKRFRTSR